MQKSQEPYWDLKLHSIIRDCTATSLTNSTGEDRFIWILQWAGDEWRTVEGLWAACLNIEFSP